MMSRMYIVIPRASHVGFPGGSAVKNLPAMQEILVQSLAQEDPLEKEMGTHSSTLAWKISWDHKGSDTTERLHLFCFNEQ